MRDGLEGMGKKKKEERDGMGEACRRGKSREGRVKRYIRRGQLKEWECIDEWK